MGNVWEYWEFPLHHILATELDDPEPSGLTKLDPLRCFGGHSKFSNGVDNKSGLGAVDGVTKAL